MKLYLGDQAHRCTESCHGESLVHVLGYQFGPDLLVVGCTVDQAIDVLDELYGQPVDMDDPALRDYGETPEQALEAAMDAGDVRCSDNGLVWVDHYEWIQSFRTPREAGAWIRSHTSQRLEVVR